MMPKVIPIRGSRSLFALRATALLLVSFSLAAQDRFDAGPYKGFVKERPELNKIELAAPIHVSSINGFISYGDKRPVPGALFEIRDKSGRVLGSKADEKGRFEIENVSPGIYAFKVTKDEFHSVVGTLVLKLGKRIKRAKKDALSIQMQLGG